MDSAKCLRALYKWGDAYALARAAGYRSVFPIDGYYADISPLEHIARQQETQAEARRALKHPTEERALLIYQWTTLPEFYYVAAPLEKILTMDREEARKMAKRSIKGEVAGTIGTLLTMGFASVGGYLTANHETFAGLATIGLSSILYTAFFRTPFSSLSPLRTETALNELYKEACLAAPNQKQAYDAAREGFEAAGADMVREINNAGITVKIHTIRNRISFRLRLFLHLKLMPLEKLQRHPAARIDEDCRNKAVRFADELGSFIEDVVKQR